MRLTRRNNLVILALIAATTILIVNKYKYRPHLTSNVTIANQGPLFDASLFKAGIPLQGRNATYSRILVMGRLSSEDVSWVTQDLPGIQTAIYTVDQPQHSNSLPANKGHEAMVYLTYIIDHYPNFPDIVIFIHPHKYAWHNNILLSVSTPETINRLSSPHVIRQGYFNTRCHLDPGCPNWLHIDRSRLLYDHKRKPEEPFLTSSLFHSLHGPTTPIPASVSQPCCAQFAVSSTRILERPLSFYTHYRSWLLNTTRDDATSGRLMEYSWHYIFTNLFTFCPSQHQCYCDGYGICFPGQERGLNEWLEILKGKEKVDEKMRSLFDKGKQATGKYARLAEESKQFQNGLERKRSEAVERGRDPSLRAEDCGRVWRDGDGY